VKKRPCSRIETTMPILHLLRHAKSNWSQPELADHDRPLAPRGQKAAALMARHIAETKLEAACILCSSARRTRDTLALILPGFAVVPETRIEPDLYLATASRLLRRLHAVPEEVTGVMLIGHNPGLHELAQHLSSRRHSRLSGKLAEKFPTCALASFRVAEGWYALSQDTAELTGFVTPAGMSD
jgi:phosphohistidine phosphatase